MKTILIESHLSDCSTHNMPAYPNGPCDCGVEWGVSFTSSNPEPQDYVACKTKEDALKLMALCADKAPASQQLNPAP